MRDASSTDRGPRGPRFGLAWKVFAASVILIVAVLGATLVYTSWQANRAADVSIRKALVNTHRAVDAQLEARTQAMTAAARAAASVPQYRTRLLQSQKREDARDQADEIRLLAGAAWAMVTNADGILIARTDKPDEANIDYSGSALFANALSGDATEGAFGDLQTHSLYYAVAIPLRAASKSAPLGVLVVAYPFDDALARTIKEATQTDLVFFSLDTLDRPFPVGATVPTSEILQALAANIGRDTSADTTGMEMAAEMSGSHYIGLEERILSAGGARLGGYVALRSRDQEMATFRTLQRALYYAFGVGFLLALLVAWIGASKIAGPVRRLAEATRKVRDGDYSVDVAVSSSDEIGMLSQDFKGLVEDLKEKSDLVEYMMSTSGAAATQPISAVPTAVRAAAAASSGTMLSPGTLFAGRYEVKEVLGMGGMGVVYRAFDRELQEPVAIKTLRTEAMSTDTVALDRFKQEIRLARKIAHRNVVRTYDLGEVNGTYYLTMEFVEGKSLKSLIEGRGRLPIPVTLTIGKQLCRALEVAHEQGVIHRDIKPQNMVVEPSGFLKVMDFGIARLANPPKGKGLTEAGMSIGTPDYMSPEQLQGLDLDPRSDLYSAGVVLFECVSGRVPFEADTPWALIAKHIEEEAPDPRTLNAEVPETLAAVILKAMGRKPEERYQTAATMYEALDLVG
ncbi:MAG TPA: protein kinase [Gemmatimonadales bacterium]|nr:protein kinase [Gemmatimonadales bacterium]